MAGLHPPRMFWMRIPPGAGPNSDHQQALAQLTEYYVALQKSLGLGWLNPCDKAHVARASRPPRPRTAPHDASPTLGSSRETNADGFSL